MGTECVSGFKFAEGDTIHGYTVLKVFEPGAFAFSGKARAPDGRFVFLKKYKRPGSACKWYDGFVAYQNELKRRIQSNDAARQLCYEFIEFFELRMEGETAPRRAFYEVFEWVEGGMTLRGVIERMRTEPDAFDWRQRVVFARGMFAGIKAIHDAGVIHAHLKPEDVLLLRASIPSRYTPRLSDFDFSLIDGQQAPWHGHDGYVGTPGYFSPEHLRNEVPLKSSDVYDGAIIIGELLGHGHPSVENMDAYDTRAQTGQLSPIVLEQSIEESPDKGFIEFVINSGLDPQPEQRPTAGELLRALHGELQEFKGRRPAPK